jgi:hypothetical protein
LRQSACIYKYNIPNHVPHHRGKYAISRERQLSGELRRTSETPNLGLVRSGQSHGPNVRPDYHCLPYNANKLMCRWDSSDPDRAPPPLPLNPVSSPGLTSRPNTSSAIQSAHAALTEKARESGYITNIVPERKRPEASPERSLIKGAAHKRMQSLQTGHVRDLSSFLESGNFSGSPVSPVKSPEKTTTRPSTPHTNKDSMIEARPSEKDASRSSTPTPTPVQTQIQAQTPTGRNTPTLRPSLRRPPQSILGENAPPQSATMLALQTMSFKDVDAPLVNVTNGSTALVRTPQTFDAISTQILSLTSIATSLQREMAQLSRRSKDNATDLVSLKEATNARDEDIRKSLRELVSGLSGPNSRSSSSYSSANGGLLIDNKPHTPNSRGSKMFSLPRIPSPTSFSASMDREMNGSPTPYVSEGTTTTIALLEKVIREMGTKEGQEQLVSRLAAIADQLSQDGAATAQKMEDLVQYVKANSDAQSLVAHAGSGGIGGGNGNNTTRGRNFSFDESHHFELDFDSPRSGPMVSRVENLLGGGANKENMGRPGPARGADMNTEEILKIIRSVKDSVAQGGGLTAEVKALVRELRGEVLGMGREIGRKLDQSAMKSANSRDSSSEKEHVARIVQDGLDELKQHMDSVLRETRRQSLSSVASRSTVDGQEVYNAVKSALAHSQASRQDSGPTLEREDIIEAVREAWENYKPDIELQHFGLEREELLSCLKEGIQEYSQHNVNRESGGASREEVFAAVVEGLKHFSPPRVEIEASLSREEILDAVRECLEEFEFPSAPSMVSREDEITREDVLDAVKEGLENFEFPSNDSALTRDIGGSLTKDDVFDAVKAGLRDSPTSTDGLNEEIIDRLNEVIETMRAEFMAVSDEAKQNVAAHGRDTEQLLDATKDGFEKLRGDIETYVDMAADVTGKDEILNSMRNSFAALRSEVEALIMQGSESSVDAIREEFDSLRESMVTSVVRTAPHGDKDEIIDALRDGLESLRLYIERPRDSSESVLSGTGEILDALQDGLNGLRAEVEKIGSKPTDPVDMTVNYEILDVLKAGLEEVRADIERLRKEGHGDRELTAITSGAVITSEGLKRNDIEHLEVLITQLQIKVEAMESVPQQSPQTTTETISRTDLANVEEAVRNMQATVSEISTSSRSVDGDSTRKEDFEAIETLLRNTKAKIDEIDPEQAVRKDHLNLVEEIVREARDGINDILSQVGETSKRGDLVNIEALIKEIFVELDQIKERSVINQAEDAEKATKTDVEAVEAVCLDIKAQLGEMLQTDLAALASKDDVRNVEELLKEFKEIIETDAEMNAKSFEERQAETVGVGERVSEIKTFLEEFKDALKEKLDEGNNGVEALGQVLTGLGDKFDETATDTKELLQTMKIEFEKSNAGVVGAKLESDEQFQKTWEKFEEKFNELMTKYDDAQLAAEAKVADGEKKAAASEAAMLSTKAIAEELKVLIDTLGTTLTDSMEKMDEASKTVFHRVEDTFTRVEETHADGKAEHQLTREQIFKTLSAVEDVRGSVTEYNPKILESIKDVLLIVGQHYEHSKTSVNSLQEKIAERPMPLPLEEQPLLKDVPVTEKYDDSPVHEKLDKLVDHMHTAGKSFAQLDMLEKIHRQVMQTAAEVSDFVSTQTQRIANDHEDKEKTLEEATIALEKKLAQKEIIEAEVNGLREQQDHLKDSVSIMKAENEDLAHQKMRLCAEVSSLETALRIRREELHAMEARAEGLERRILEGVIDHSRAFLLNKGASGRDPMNLKRVPSHSTSTTGSVLSTSTRRSRASNTTQSAVNMAMNGNRALTTIPINNPAGASRRILSLNQITHNVPTGGFKRSHSVKAPGGGGALRKSSWGGSLSRRDFAYGELNKENLALKEGEEESDEGDDSRDPDDVSEAGTMRRTSQSTLETGLSSEVTGSTIDEGTEWSGSITDGETEDGGSVVLYGEVV